MTNTVPILPPSSSHPKRVRILQDTVVNQIAAGEVVERPASVVKELVENSIDAHATSITVLVDNGGGSAIEVIDDGCGMTRDDALVAIERFGTSKIEKAEDLFSIETLGFRGEALPSIASVSKFSLQTSPWAMPADGADYRAEVSNGIAVILEGGRLREVNEIPLPKGTRVKVRQLFYNIPARRRFLRSAPTETGLIKILITDFALAFPQLRLKLITDGKESLHYLPTAGFLERATTLKIAGGRAQAIDGLPSQTPEGVMRLQALLSEPLSAVSDSGKLRFIVNGRTVRDRLLLRAVRDGYGNFLKSGKYPIGALNIEVPASEVDVNVHPQKTEVRFRRPEMVFSLVLKAVTAALSHVHPLHVVAPSVAPLVAETKPFWSFRDFRGSHLSQPPAVEFFPPIQSENSSQNETSSYEATQAKLTFSAVFHQRPTSSPQGLLEELQQPETSSSSFALSNFRFVGQIFHCYLLFEGEHKFIVVDMHAAHERVTFFEFKQQLLQSAVIRQTLLVAEVIELPLDRVQQYETFQPVLSKLGVESELFGTDCIIVRSLPALLGNVSAKAIFQDLLALPSWTDWGNVVGDAWDGVIARFACHGSVRSGRNLKAEEAYCLLESLQRVETSAFCPHGRPVLKVLSRYELESMFGR